MSTRLCLVLGAVLAAALPVSAQQPGQPTYEALLERLKKGDPKVDFAALRLAYAQTPAYSPYNPDRDNRGAMLRALENKNYKEALERAERELKKNYVDVTAHVVAYKAFTGLNDPERAGFHRRVFDGLIKSILKSGNGKAPDTAFVVISTDEEYTLLNALGIRRGKQALVKLKGHSFDRLEGTDAQTGRALTLYFNIDRPMEWLARSLGGKK
jgi:hypothetical protein